MFRIAVLMTCYNRRVKTLECLDSLLNRQKECESYILDVYLVDDGSTDGTGTAVREKYPGVFIIKSSGNLFWNRGMHLAWITAAERIDYDYYLWLNDDTILYDEAISSLVGCSKEKGSKSIIVGSTYSTNINQTSYGGFSKNNELISPNNSLQECICFHGNCVLIPRYVYNIVGILDPFYWHAIGDFDYGLRAKKNLISSYILPNFVGVCEPHDSLPKWCLSSTPFLERIKSLYSPLGNSQPIYYFRFEYRHYGLLVALKHLLSIHLRLCVPNLWTK